MAKHIWHEGRWVPVEEFKAPRTELPAVQSDYEPYQCVGSGETIGGRRQHREMLARAGLRVKENSERTRVIKTDLWARRLGVKPGDMPGR